MNSKLTNQNMLMNEMDAMLAISWIIISLLYLHAQTKGTKETKRTKNGHFKSFLIGGTRVHFIFDLIDLECFEL